jgi:hypothetical protein
MVESVSFRRHECRRTGLRSFCRVGRLRCLRRTLFDERELKMGDNDSYSCYNPERRKFFPSITSSIFDIFEKFLD